MMPAIAFSDLDVQVEVRERAAPLVRLFRYPGAAFSEPPEAYRNGRFDPPPGAKSDFAVLYAADSIGAAAMETRVLRVSADDEYSYAEAQAKPYKVARLQYVRPALFIRLDSAEFRKKLGIRRFPSDGYLSYQQAAHALYKRFGDTVSGLSWESFHRGQPGRNYGIWHHRKSSIELSLMQEEEACPALLEDDEWLQLLRDMPCIALNPDLDPR